MCCCVTTWDPIIYANGDDIVLWLRLACVLASWSVVGCTERRADSREQECEHLRDHVIEMRVASIPRSPEPTEDFSNGGAVRHHAAPVGPDIDGHRVALKQALGREYIDSCLANLTQEQLDCSLTAKDSAGITSCQTTTRPSPMTINEKQP